MFTIKICVTLNEGQGQYNHSRVSSLMMTSIVSEKSLVRDIHTDTDTQSDRHRQTHTHTHKSLKTLKQKDSER